MTRTKKVLVTAAMIAGVAAAAATPAMADSHAPNPPANGTVTTMDSHQPAPPAADN